ncbi:hypothetical protein NHH73_05630 [Oxalobacteraceae bacterium OTU3CINTB1]|nr:hypothetical protein NHH73_05630 [Oxalobacteraceae bacterium OTU3CINTB1]
MVNITNTGNQARVIDSKASSGPTAEVQKPPGSAAYAVDQAASAGVVSGATSISTLAARLSKASTSITESTKGLDHKALNAKAEKNIQTILYPFEGAQKAAAAKQLPQPSDAASTQSASAATAYLEGNGANPFKGLSREQLSTIANDDSGSFTINEKRAAYRQAHSEEEAWRMQVIAKAVQEYESSGKLTEFFKESLAHFMDLPKMEQARYPEDYASGLADKIKLDFNYLTHAAGDGAPTPGSLATLNTHGNASDIADLIKFPD